jgi:threonine synthase
LEAIRRSHGTAIAVDEAEVAADWQCLARHGVYVELSSAAALTGARVLARSWPRIAHCILVATSHGYKELAAHLSSPKSLASRRFSAN